MLPNFVSEPEMASTSIRAVGCVKCHCGNCHFPGESNTTPPFCTLLTTPLPIIVYQLPSHTHRCPLIQLIQLLKFATKQGSRAIGCLGSLTKFDSKKGSYVDISTLGYIQKGATYFLFYSYLKIPQLSRCCLAGCLAAELCKLYRDS